MLDPLQPFVEFPFMRKALSACVALSVSTAPLGVFLILRRMSLMGDALSHAVLPGAAVGYLVAGFSLAAMTVGGLTAGLIVALASGAVSRFTAQREDAAFAAFYLVALALGVLLISLRGTQVDVMRVLFGSLLAVEDEALVFIALVATLTLVALALTYRALVIECFDPAFLRAHGARGSLVHMLFLALVVVNLVAGFQALGTLLSVGLMMVPAAAARLWARELPRMMALAIAFALAASVGGLVASYALDVASGPAVVLAAGLVYGASLLAAPKGLLYERVMRPAHRRA